MTHRTKRPAAAAAVIVFTALAALLPCGLSAQSTDSGPALGVARISLVGGEVTTKRGDSGDWVAARINQPVVEGDSVMTGPGSRAEIQLDYGNLVRLNGNSEIEFASLGNRKFQIRVARGSIGYSELRDSEADVDIETPLVAVRPAQSGRYRIDLGPGETVVTVRKGTAEVASVNGLETLGSGRTMIVREGVEGPEFRLAKAEPKDDWDRWAEARDNRLKKSESYRYVSRDIYGAEALDDYGDWRHVSGYGYSWFPRSTASGWAPYRQGRWTWLDYYGWSWVGSEPWGWAPYHWGRWYHHASYGWGWYPGSLYRRHFWRPALVTFFGYNGYSGLNFGLGYGYGNIGWCPLGPGEIYSPWYGSGFYGGRPNRTVVVDNSVNIYNTYRNARAPNGVTVVDAQGFSQGLVNNPRTLRSAELTRATSIRGQIPVVPARGSQGTIVRAATAATGGASAARSLRSGVPSTGSRRKSKARSALSAICRLGQRPRAASGAPAARGAVARTGAPLFRDPHRFPGARRERGRCAHLPFAAQPGHAPRRQRFPKHTLEHGAGKLPAPDNSRRRNLVAVRPRGALGHEDKNRRNAHDAGRTLDAAADLCAADAIAGIAAQRRLRAPGAGDRPLGAQPTVNTGSASSPRVFAPRSRSRVSTAAPSARSRSTRDDEHPAQLGCAEPRAQRLYPARALYVNQEQRFRQRVPHPVVGIALLVQRRLLGPDAVRFDPRRPAPRTSGRRRDALVLRRRSALAGRPLTAANAMRAVVTGATGVYRQAVVRLARSAQSADEKSGRVAQ